MEMSSPSAKRRRMDVTLKSIEESPAIQNEDADDEERNCRRKSVVILKRMSNIAPSTSSPLQDLRNALSEKELKAQLQFCSKLFTENKISVKNAWELQIIDIFKHLVATEKNNNVLQVGSTSLDIGAKVYGCRVDDVHSKCLKLAETIANAKEGDGHNDNNDDADETHVGGKRKKIQRKKKIGLGKKCTVDSDEKILFQQLRQLESVQFSIQEHLQKSAADNLLTNKIRLNEATHQFDLHNNKKFWVTKKDLLLDGNDDKFPNQEMLLDGVSQNVEKLSFCDQLAHLDAGKWNPADDDDLLEERVAVQNDMVIDDDGVPVPELDGSVHNIFEEADAGHISDDLCDEQDHLEQIQFEARRNGNFQNVVDAIPEASRNETDYGYNALLLTSSGKIIDKIWAGPNHWKLKCLRNSHARFSGSVQTAVIKQVRKQATKPQPKDVTELPAPDFDEFYVNKRKASQANVDRITLPTPCYFASKLGTREMETMSLFSKPHVTFVPRQMPNDMEFRISDGNDNGSFHSQNPGDDGSHCNEPMDCSMENGDMGQHPNTILEDGLVEKPETVVINAIEYATHAKQMDMKKLKNAIWNILTDCERGSGRVTNSKILTTFQSLYKELLVVLPNEMMVELSCALAFTALLHLCNEKNLILSSYDSHLLDFNIEKAF